MGKIRVLICDDDAGFLARIVAVTKVLVEKVEVVVTTNLGGLTGTVAQGKNLNAIFLDGYLAHGETTLPFLRQLSEGKFQHLKNTCFYLISSDRDMCMSQLEFLTDAVGEDIWKWTTCKKEGVAAEIRRLAMEA